MTEQVKMSTYFKLPASDLIKQINANETIPINCDGVGEYEAAELAINSYDASQERIAKLESMLCSTCGGIGCIGTPPDNYQDCPECVGPIQKLSDDNYRKGKQIAKQQEQIKLLREAVAAGLSAMPESWLSDEMYNASVKMNEALAATKQDKD